MRSTGGNRLAVADGVVYVGSGSATEAMGDATVAALDAETGLHIWRHDAEGYVSTPAIVGDTIYIGTGVERTDDQQTGAIRALNAADGEALWSYEVDGIATSPIVIDGRVYFSATTTVGDTSEQTLYAIG
jgi:outer membrane protein assembly factor BamB